MSKRTKKPKREFSKLILYVVGAVTVGGYGLHPYYDLAHGKP